MIYNYYSISSTCTLLFVGSSTESVKSRILVKARDAMGRNLSLVVA